MKKTYDEYAGDALQLTADIIEKHGPRVSGTQGCYSSSDELEKLLAGNCTSIRRESFWIHPGSLLAIGKIFTVIYLVGVFALFSESRVVASIGLVSMITGVIYFTAQFILYLDTFDGIFKKVSGNNIIGIIEPANTVRQNVVLVSHHDSSYIFPFYEKMPSLFPIRFFIPVFLFVFCLAVLCYSTFSGIFSGRTPLFPIWIKYTLCLGLIFVVPMYWYISKRPSPGAGDNLIGCTINIKLAEIFRDGVKALQNTRLIVLLTDGEEVGQKGAKSFINKNRELLNPVNTIVINIDSIYDYEDIAIVKRDINGFIRLSVELANSIRAVAMELGHSIKTISIPFGGGGTDGGQFAREKIETVSIIGTPANMLRKEIILHTTKDTPEKISLKAVSAVIEVVSEFIRKSDLS
ncbi:MAG: M28 family peptidase [Bacteroidia bacterium]|nr:M28 family peptidase [Bacteroidia bacterium]